ncbi:MAG: class I SAM-dependent methyltransferase [Parachlamydiaceae bacterium]
MSKSLNQTYTLLDSGHGKKLEKFGPYVIVRPCAQAVWNPALTPAVWAKADAAFTRESDTKWSKTGHLPDSWEITVAGITFKISPTDFGHLGIFPEQKRFWEWIQEIVHQAKISDKRSSVSVLNLFAYSGGSTLAAAKGGAQVCHLDASKGIVGWARDNAALSGLSDAPIRWIVDDVSKFLAREVRRGVRYDAIILDPPSFGRGSRGEVFKIEDNLQTILADCQALLSDHPLFILFSCHSPGFSPIVMEHLIRQMMAKYSGTIDTGEMLLLGNGDTLPLPSGVYARWQCGK